MLQSSGRFLLRRRHAVVEHLRDTMEALRFPVGAAAQILADAGSIRNEALGR